MVLQVVVPFRRSSLNLVNRTKHVVDSEGSLAAQADSTNAFAQEVNVKAAVFNPVEVLLGSHINGVFISLFVLGDTGSPIVGSINWYIAKKRAGQAFTDFPNPGNTGISDIRNQIFHEEKGLAGSGDGTPMAFKGVIAIPKGMRRMRAGDEFFINIRQNSVADTAQFCLKVIYNEYI